MKQSEPKKKYTKPRVADYGDLVEMTAITVIKKTSPDALRGRRIPRRSTI